MSAQEMNHPAKGSKGEITVDPIREAKDIKLIKKMLAGNARDLAIFTVGINTNLRASDLLAMKVGHVRGLKADEEFTITEQKTEKVRRISMNNGTVAAVAGLLATDSMKEADNDDLLFQSRKKAVQRKQIVKNGVEGKIPASGELAVSCLNRLVKGWCKEAKIKGNFGSHTLRKTFGYQQRMAGASLPLLMEAFNHSTQRQTLAYLGIQPEELKELYRLEI